LRRYVRLLPEGLLLRLLRILLCLLLYGRAFWRKEAAELEDKI